MPQEKISSLTKKFLQAHPEIQACLGKDLVNYSSLARLICKESGIEKKNMLAVSASLRRMEHPSLNHQGLPDEFSQAKIAYALTEFVQDLSQWIRPFHPIDRREIPKKTRNCYRHDPGKQSFLRLTIGTYILFCRH